MQRNVKNGENRIVVPIAGARYRASLSSDARSVIKLYTNNKTLQLGEWLYELCNRFV